jgi:hypothetical protein
MIFKGSRYQNVKAYQAVASNGQTVTALSIRFIPPTPAEKFWLIADANTEMDPEDLADPGRQLLIPPDRT